MIIGLTGGIASGKSTVARLLKERGAVHIDADAIVRELYADNQFGRQVQTLFEEPILNNRGEVDRALLGEIVFNDAEALKRLEKLVHPAVAQLRIQKMQDNADAIGIVWEAVKLIEAGQADKCDVVWCVRSQPDIQLHRLMQNRHLSESEARTRLAHQPSCESKRALLQAGANAIPFVLIENNGSLEELEAKVEAEWEKLTAKS
jgi:dephospho-CoA kinase